MTHMNEKSFKMSTQYLQGVFSPIMACTVTHPQVCAVLKINRKS